MRHDFDEMETAHAQAIQLGDEASGEREHPFMVDVQDVDDFRERIYARMDGE